MEFFLDSANFEEIEEALKLGFIDGVTTTPTFMHLNGLTDVDGAIVKLSKMVPVLMIEALGDKAEDIVAEAHRLLALGLDKKKTVFKIPVSMEGVRACKMLRNEDILVNIHLVYNIQQALLALTAGATYVCVLVGRMQDQGHNALELVGDIVDAIDHYGYDSKLMFSSVRHAEHIRNAMLLGAHNITIPWKVMKKLADNNFTKVGTDQFVADTRMITMQVKEVISDHNPVIEKSASVMEALIKMSESGLGAVSVIDKEGKLEGIFTDGDLRRQLRDNGQNILQEQIEKHMTANPLSIDSKAMLKEATGLIEESQVDNLVVVQDGKPVGMLDVQDLIKLDLLK